MAWLLLTEQYVPAGMSAPFNWRLERLIISTGENMKQVTHFLVGASVALLPLLALGLPGVASAIPVTLNNPTESTRRP